MLAAAMSLWILEVLAVIGKTKWLEATGSCAVIAAAPAAAVVAAVVAAAVVAVVVCWRPVAMKGCRRSNHPYCREPNQTHTHSKRAVVSVQAQGISSNYET